MNFLDLSAYINDVYTWITQAFLAVVNSSEWFIDTIGSQIDNREIATLILSTLLFAFALIKIKNPVINGLIDIARSVLTPYLLIPFILLIGYSSGVIYIALQLKCWTSSLLLDTIIEITFVGIPSMYIAVKAHSIKAIFKQLVLPEISIGAFAVYYIGLDSFSIPAELLLQTIVLILVYTKTIYGRDQKKKTLVKKIDTILALIGIALLAIVTNKLVTNWNTVEWLDELQTFLMTIWYPVSMLPFAILLGYYSALEALLRRVKISQVKPLKAIFLFLAILPFLKDIHSFHVYEANQYVKCSTWKERWSFIRRYKKTIREKARAENQKMKRMKLGKGKHGFDENGLWYDWDNLSNIKNALWFIAGMQNNNWIKTNKYMSDMQNKIVDMHTPPGCIGEIYVSADCKTYVCWMRNGTGFTFGIAASEGLFPPKKFEGEDVPTIDANDPLVSFKSDQGAEALPNWHASFHIGSSYS